MFQTIEFEVKGIAPTIMHNGQLVDPMNPIVRKMKEFTAKKSKKTDDDMVELARLEFLGSLYLTDKNKPCWPGENIETMVRAAARTERRGKDVEKAVLCDGNWPLIYDGPSDPEKLWEDARFRLVKAVKVGPSRVMRTRPIFPAWSLKFTLHYDSELVNREDVVRWVEIAGREIGLSEWRPKHGRFEVLGTK
jgi:hypothetical protein